MKKRILSLLLVAVMMLGIALSLASCGHGPEQYVVIEVEGYGTMVVALYSKYAPLTVENFISLANEGFYDGLIFHRVIPGFMIQGGDPEGTGMGGSDKNLKGEFAINKWNKNTLSHKRGVISMARQGHPLESYYGEQIPFEQREPYYNSATSQFFIVHQDSPHLDGQYAAFGEVIYGIEVVDAIAKVSVNISDKPKTDIVMSRVYVVTYEEAQAIMNGN